MAERSPEGGAGEAAKGAAPAAPAAGGGMQAWMPLLVTLIAMPAIAFAATKFLIVPQVQKALHAPVPDSASAAAPAASGGAHGGGGGGGGGGSAGGHGSGESKQASAKESMSYKFSKVIVNVAGTMGTRYLMSTFTVVGANADFRNRVEERKDELVDLASTTLGSKTIAELEKPGGRNQVKAELIAIFNAALGEGAVKDIHITEFAIQ